MARRWFNDRSWGWNGDWRGYDSGWRYNTVDWWGSGWRRRRHHHHNWSSDSDY